MILCRVITRIKFYIAFKELKTVCVYNKQYINNAWYLKNNICEFYIIMVDLAKTSISTT